jgi:hypothetical protein
MIVGLFLRAAGLALARGTGRAALATVTKAPVTTALAVDAATGFNGSKWALDKAWGGATGSLTGGIASTLKNLTGAEIPEKYIGWGLGGIAALGASKLLGLGDLIPFLALGAGVFYVATQTTLFQTAFNSAANAMTPAPVPAPVPVRTSLNIPAMKPSGP